MQPLYYSSMNLFTHFGYEINQTSSENLQAGSFCKFLNSFHDARSQLVFICSPPHIMALLLSRAENVSQHCSMLFVLSISTFILSFQRRQKDDMMT